MKKHSVEQRLLNRDLLQSGAYHQRIERNKKKEIRIKHRGRQFDGLIFTFNDLMQYV